MFPHPANAFDSTRPWSVAHRAVGGGWAFDLISFAIGFACALLLVGLIYRYRDRIAGFWNQVREKADQLRRRLTASMATRYRAGASKSAQTSHLLGALAPLDSVFVEMQLHAPLALPAEENDSPRSLSPLQAIHAGDRLCIIGAPGSGRTTLLNHLLLLHADQDRAVRGSERVPVYVYLPALATDLKEGAEAESTDGKEDLPAQQLTRTALSFMSHLVATGVARWLQRQIAAGNALVLLDGWDEVPAADRPDVTAWIQELFTAHPGNRLVVTAGERGHAPLIEAGFIPLQPVPWTHRQFAALVRNWAAAWPFKKGEQDESSLSISYALTPPTPLEATIELAIQLHGRTPAITPAGKMAQVMDLLLPPPQADDKERVAWPIVTGHRALGQLALAALEQGRLMLAREEIQSAVTEAMPPPQFALDEEPESDVTELRLDREEEERRTLQIVDCCRALTSTGAPIRTWDAERYFFAHPLVAAYLAARHLASEGTSIVNRADDPAWFNVLRFHVGLALAEPLIEQLLSTPGDLFLNHLWKAASLLAAASPDQVPWRAKLVKRLGQLFMNPRLPAPLHNRCLAALVHSGEPGVELLFKKATGHADPQLRAAAIVGLGALGCEEELTLMEAALADASPKVRLAAVKALSMIARMGGEAAMDHLIATLLEAEAAVQRVAVEALATLGAEGHAVLRDAAGDHDLIVRRAAVYGLAATDEPWAMKTLEKLQQEDEEWLVRNAATEALDNVATRNKADIRLELALPEAETEPWLIAWAAERGEGTGVGKAALATLMRAMAEGDLAIRRMAIGTLGRLADPRTVDILRQTLRDPEPSIREAALLALDEISHRCDLTITMA